MAGSAYLCVHGHFYQPPRENPWTGEIDRQPTAQPYHDWNERITAECYGPNAEFGNYARMSFNFGPTLLSWMERKAPESYAAVLKADRESRQRFSGHGSAMAQAYHHLILPLANRRDRVTQVVWGIRDFEHRFGRKPEGMWIPETAVDLETLEILAEQGIRFTVLAPHQAAGPVDSTIPYWAKLPNGRRLALFFYNGALSQAVAFQGVLQKGSRLQKKFEEVCLPLLSAHLGSIVHLATDGETYGHHDRQGARALREAFRGIEASSQIRLTNYGEFLERFPPQQEAQILEKSSWSCTHGIDRWWSDCGCAAGGHADWNQRWRTPLRNGLDWLRDWVAPRYEERAGLFFKDPWRAREESIRLLLDPSTEEKCRFFERESGRVLREGEQETALCLLELQRLTLLMYTSCGWFFDDLSRIETVQILRYAARAIELAQTLWAEPLEEPFLKILEEAVSNVPGAGNGRRLYERLAKRSASAAWDARGTIG